MAFVADVGEGRVLASSSRCAWPVPVEQRAADRPEARLPPDQAPSEPSAPSDSQSGQAGQAGQTFVAYRGAVTGPGDTPGTYGADPRRTIESALLETGRSHLTASEISVVEADLAQP